MKLPGKALDGLRPDPRNGAQRLTHCFYCHMPLGIGTHLANCPTQRKTVVVEMRVKMVVDVPQYYTERDIDFFLNDSSHCAINEIRQLHTEATRVPNECCVCDRTEFMFLRDATEEDHKNLSWQDTHEA